MALQNTATITAFPTLTEMPAPLPLREVLPWAAFIGVLAVVTLYFVGVEQGATSLFSGTFVHEFVHDGRHLLGFPCH